MYPSVEAAFWNFTTGLEGYEDGMYADILGLVTSGIGDLLDPISLALALPWLHRDTGLPATSAEVAAEWHAVKDGRIPAWKGKRPLYLTTDAIRQLVNGRLAQNEGYLARRWATWASWPADAQLGAHSVAWAAGAAWRAPKFDAAADSCSPVGFRTCVTECLLRDVGNPGLHRRNLQNQQLFANAAAVLSLGQDPSVLIWPASAGT